MDNDFYGSMLDAAKSVYSAGSDPVSGGYILDHVFTDLNNTGFGAAAFRNATTGEFIISFTGTQDVQDWSANILSMGWNQWTGENASAVLAYLDDIVVNQGATKIHFTGHSLGGALAQYAAYEYADILPPDERDSISLTTFNALGGVDGLKQYRVGGYDANLFNIIEATHYYTHGDLVSQLGGGHLGGNTYILYNTAGNDPSIPMDLLTAHDLGTVRAIVYNGIDWDFQDNTFEPIKYLKLATVQQLGGVIGQLFNDVDGEIDPGEATLRMVTALIGTVTIINTVPTIIEEFVPGPGEINRLLQAALTNFADSATFAGTTTGALARAASYINWESAFGKLTGGPGGGTLVTGIALFAAVMNDIAEGQGDYTVLPDWVLSQFTGGQHDIALQNIQQFLSDNLTSALSLVASLTGNRSASPGVTASDFSMAEDVAAQLVFSLDTPAKAGGQYVYIQVGHPAKVTLSGTGVSSVGEPVNGLYKVLVAEDAVTATVDVTVTADNDAFNDWSSVKYYTSAFEELNEVFFDLPRATAFIDITDTTIVTPGGYVLTNGTNDPDDLTGTAGQDEMHGFGDDDDLNGDAGDDLLYGDAGDDLLIGGVGADGLYGGAGRDMLHAGDWRDVLYGEDGNDFLSGQDGDDLISGDDGDDLLSGGSGSDWLIGGLGADLIYGDATYLAVNRGWSYTVGSNGVTVTIGLTNIGELATAVSGDYYIEGGAGNDNLVGDNPPTDTGDDTIYGGIGHDVIHGGSGNDTLSGEIGMGKATLRLAA
jgi:Ca2+-binding RTX toxin-like protein